MNSKFKNLAKLAALTYTQHKFLRDYQDEFNKWKQSLVLRGIDRKEIDRVYKCCIEKGITTKHSATQLMGIYLHDVILNGKITDESKFIFEPIINQMTNIKKHRIERSTVLNTSAQLRQNLEKFDRLLINPDELKESNMVALLSYYEQLQEQMHRFSSAVTRLTINVTGKYESR